MGNTVVLLVLSLPLACTQREEGKHDSQATFGQPASNRVVLHVQGMI